MEKSSLFNGSHSQEAVNVIDFYLQGTQQNVGTFSMTKDNLKHLLCPAQSDQERECIKYAVLKSSGLTPTAARKFYGFQYVTTQ